MSRKAASLTGKNSEEHDDSHRTGLKTMQWIYMNDVESSVEWARPSIRRCNYCSYCVIGGGRG